MIIPAANLFASGINMSKPVKDTKISIPESMLKELLTDSEWRMIQNRWRIMQMVREGLTIRKIAEEVKVGSDTVVRTIRMMEERGMSKTAGKKKPQTPWIFGKSNE